MTESAEPLDAFRIMPEVTKLRAPDQRLIQAGFALFLLGLLTGFAAPLLKAPRMGLSSHLEGLFNGLFLIALGLVWPRLTLGKRAATALFFLALYAAFANWLATLLAAVWGAGGLMSIAGGGAVGTPLQEFIVAALLVTLSLAIVVAVSLALWGLRGRRT